MTRRWQQVPGRSGPRAGRSLLSHSHPHFLLLGLVALFALTGSYARPRGTSAAPLQTPPGATQEVVIGLLDSFTGNGSSFGQNNEATVALAVSDVNAAFAAAGNPIQLRLVTADTQLDPAMAAKQIQALAAQGAQIVIGPETSAELQAVIPFATANGMLVISQGSTAFSLSTPGDNIFRFVPNDRHEAQALLALLKLDQNRALVPLWRGDLGNDDLKLSLEDEYSAVGGTVLNGFRYNPDATDFSGAIASISAQVVQAQQRYGPNVGVYLAGFDEAAQIFDVARTDPVLSSVPWYGTDGTALSAALTGDQSAASFAARVEFSSPLLGLDEGLRSRWQPIQDRAAATTGRIPDSGSLAAYDAVWVAALTEVLTNNTRDAATLQRAFAETANSYYGITGPTAVDEGGDRIFADYDFWGIRNVDGVLQWTKVAHYSTSLDASGGTLIQGQ
jgi:branched-chain amino acid transport system substrate-binding protein